MELRTLRSFIAVAKLKSFSAAARELHIVQPAISRQIASLEEELGVSLFWRNTREVKITAAGEVLLVEAHAMIALEGRAKEYTQRAARGQAGNLRIGYISSACSGFIPTLVRAYAQRYPHVAISLQDLTVEQQLDAFDKDSIDVGFSRPLPDTSRHGLAAELIYMDTLAVVLSKEHRLAYRKALALHELAAEPFVLFERSEAAGLFDQIIGACQREHFSPHIVSQPVLMQTLLTEVASGLGVAVAPRCITSLNRTGCVFIPIKRQKLLMPIELHYPDTEPRPTVAAFVELTRNLKHEIQQLVSRQME